MDLAFELEGFCVVRGPDLLWGGDVRRFHPPAGVFDGVTGGPPCKPFSPLAYLNAALGRSPRHPNLIPEYERVVGEARPAWFLMENVPLAPEPVVNGYLVRSQVIDNRWIGDGVGQEQSRDRRFSFGTADGRCLDVSPDLALFENPTFEYAVRGTSGGWLKKNGRGYDTPAATIERQRKGGLRPLARLLELQGLPADYLDDAPFRSDAKREVVGNGVPLPLGRAMARAVKRAMGYALEEATP